MAHFFCHIKYIPFLLSIVVAAVGVALLPANLTGALLAAPITSSTLSAESSISSSDSITTIEKCGTIEEDETWTADEDIYLVTCNVTVSSNVTLTISSGVIAKFDPNSSLLVNGALRVLGTATEPVTFTSYRDDSAGGDSNEDGSSSGAVRDWRSIHFNADSDDANSIIEHAIIRYSGHNSAGAIVLDNASPTLRQITFEDNALDGVDIDGGEWQTDTWDNTDLRYYVTGRLRIPADQTLTVATGMQVNFLSSVMVANQGTLLLQPGVVAKFGFHENLFVDGTLQIQGTAANPVYLTSYKDDTVGSDSNNDGNASTPAVRDWGSIHFNASSDDANSIIEHAVIRYSGDGFPLGSAGAIVLDNASPTLRQITFEENALNGVDIDGNEWQTDTWDNTDLRYYITSQLSIPAGHTLTVARGMQVNFLRNVTVGNQGTLLLQPGVVAKFDSNLLVDGTLQVQGTASNPVYLTSYKDDTVGSDSNNDGNASTPAVRDWGQIRFDAESDEANSIIEHAVIRYSGAGFSFGAIRLDSTSISISNTTFEHNYRGVEAFSGAAPTIFNSSFIDTQSFAVFNDTPDEVEVDARFNWWGSELGPFHATLNPNGSGDQVSDGVLFDPWLTEPPIGIDREAIPLSLGSPVEGEVTSLGWQDYSLTVPAGLLLLVEVTPLADEHTLWLFARSGQLSNFANYDLRTDKVAGRGTYELLLPSTQATTYYFSIFNRNTETAQTPFRIKAQSVEGYLSDVTPRSAGNAGSLTLQLSGLGFVDGMQVELRRDGSPTLVASSVTRFSEQSLIANFDLQGAATGTYDVRVTSGESNLVLEEGFEITIGVGARLETSIEGPSAVRPERDGTVWLNYANVGDADMPAPLFIISTAGISLPMKLQEEAPYEPIPVQVLGINFEGPAGVLPPGASGRIPIHFQAITEMDQIEFNLEVVEGNNTTIDWDELEPDLRPDEYDETLWAAIWDNFKEQIGTTAADYQRALDERATYLSQFGHYIYDARELFALMLSRASGDYLPQTLASSIDAAAPSRGLPLTFVRVAQDALQQRFRVGPFGRGWSHNFEFQLVAVDDNTITIELPSGGGRRFIKKHDGSWQASSGDNGSLVPDSDGTYQLREIEGVIWQFDAEGRLTYMEESNGNRITLQYTASQLTQISHSTGQQFTLTYNERGRISRLTDHAGRETTYSYDASGQHLLTVVAPGDVTTNYSYHPVSGAITDHALQEIAFADGTHLYYAYDDKARLSARWRDGNAERVEFTYDEFGTVFITDAEGATSTVRLGLYGQPLLTENSLGDQVQFQYDNELNLVEMNLPQGEAPEITYDSQGNPIRIEDPLGHTTYMGYTSDLNRLDWLRDAKQNQTEFDYDRAGNLTEITYPDNTTQEFDYDGGGNLTNATNRRRHAIQFAYNEFGQVTRKTYPNGQLVNYTYDAVGRLTSVTDAKGTISLEYDTRSLLTRIEYPSGHAFSYTYNNAGRRTQMVSDDGYTLNYHYDAAGRLERLTDGSGTEMVRYQYDQNGRLASETKGNETTTTYTYDAAGQLTRLVNAAADGTVQSRFEYAYDANGNRTSQTTLEGTTSYSYDAAGQLVGVTYPDGRQESYSYDEMGNRITVADGGNTTNYTTNNMNQYSQVGNVTYTYDADGNMTSKSDSSGTTTYEYDYENRLVRVVAPDNNSWAYTYDALGNRIAVEHNGVMTRFVHDPTGLVDVAAEYDANGALIARYVHGLGLAARIDAANNAAYYAFDAIGNTRQMTNHAGAVVNRYDYTPFGISLQEDEAIANPFQYVGRFGVMDEGNGLQFMRARFYDESIGRFITEDPIGLVGGDANLYTYAGNNPLSKIDPRGTFWSWVSGAIIGGVISAGSYLLDTLWAENNDFTWGGLFGSTVSGALTGAVTFGTAGFAAAGSLFEGALLGSIYGGAFNEIGQIVENLINGNPWDQHLERVYLFGFLTGWFPPWKGLPPSLTLLVGQIPSAVCRAHSKICNGILDFLVDVIRPLDPNDKLGPRNVGIPPDEELVYTIRFENVMTATAPVQELFIEDYLDPDLDWSTLTYLNVGYGDQQVSTSGDSLQFSRRHVPPSSSTAITGTAEGQLAIDMTGLLDPQTGRIEWRFKVIDTQTEEFPEDPFAGFLPPEDKTGRGQGHVTFSIKPKPDIELGTVITNSASIVFDTNEAIETNEVRNVIEEPTALELSQLDSHQKSSNFPFVLLGVMALLAGVTCLFKSYWRQQAVKNRENVPPLMGAQNSRRRW
ncbi:MAG: RHS repeat domain-containing protein [Ardenticatenaceae bacterium]